MVEILMIAVRRLFSAAATLFVVSMMIFAAVHALPGGYADVFLGAHPTPEAKARIEHQFGLAEPLPVQYGRWLWSAAQGDFGISLVTQRPVAEEFALRLPITAEIALMATIIAIIVGLPFGILGGMGNKRPVVQTSVRIAGSLAISIPDFVIGSILLFLISRFGSGQFGWEAERYDWWARAAASFMPALALSALGIGFVMTSARHATITAREGPWVMAAIARGMPMGQIARHHVLKNAAIPVVTVISIYVGYMLGGTAIVETTFTVPGLGHYVMQAVSLRDYPVVQAAALVAAVAFITCNLIADILYVILDPRIRTK